MGNMKYLVIVKAISEQPWTDYVAESLEEAWSRRMFIEAELRGVRVDIIEVEREVQDGSTS
jgi:hypothetical protein